MGITNVDGRPAHRRSLDRYATPAIERRGFEAELLFSMLLAVARSSLADILFNLAASKCASVSVSSYVSMSDELELERKGQYGGPESTVGGTAPGL